MTTIKPEMSESACARLRCGHLILQFLATPGQSLNAEQEAAVETLGELMYWSGREDEERAMLGASPPVTDFTLGVE